MTTPWYDTKDGIQEAVDKGIGGLVELSKARRDAGYDRKEYMTEWCVLQLFYLSSNGNFGKIVEGAPREHPRGYKLGDVATVAEAKAITGEGWSYSYTMAELPPSVEKCARCLRGWDKRNIFDHHERHKRDSPHIHETCHKLQSIETEQEFFKEVMERSEMPYTSMRAIPNEYHSGLYQNPWFIVETQWGPIRMGWRKRVINIDWSSSDIKHDGTVLFKEICDKGITCWETGIHAYGKDKAIEHLRVLSQGN